MSKPSFITPLVGPRGLCAGLLACQLLLAAPVEAVDPPYQEDMQQLIENMGSLYFLTPLCGYEKTDWREAAAELIALDNPEEDRRQRLIGWFNTGYESFARLYRFCSIPARQAMTRLLDEAAQQARDIHSRYAE